jgi:hypothetical protein
MKGRMQTKLQAQTQARSMNNSNILCIFTNYNTSYKP